VHYSYHIRHFNYSFGYGVHVLSGEIEPSPVWGGCTCTGKQAQFKCACTIYVSTEELKEAERSLEVQVVINKQLKNIGSTTTTTTGRYIGTTPQQQGIVMGLALYPMYRMKR
jgi:hypothetical protein